MSLPAMELFFACPSSRSEDGRFPVSSPCNGSAWLCPCKLPKFNQQFNNPIAGVLSEI